MAKAQLSAKQEVQTLERLMKKVLRVAFKDNTLDYTIQIAASSLEPDTVKYAFMINGLKKEIQPIALSFPSFEVAKGALEGLLDEVDLLKLEQMFHQGRINVYKNAITSHEDRMKHLEEHGLDDEDGIEMEVV